MMPKLPPLHLIKVFETAGTQLSFKRAAEELHVTPSAVSHQIKALEDHLGVPLFRRMNRALALTEAGQAYLRVVQDGLRVLRQGHSQTLRRFGKPQLRVSVLPFLASEVVIPNLHTFQRQHPAIELRLETGLHWVDFEHNDIDMAIRYGNGSWPGLASDRLMDILVTPVCSQAYLDQLQIRSIKDLLRCTLISTSNVPDAWDRCFDILGLPQTPDKQELWLDAYPAILQAAERGLGIALGMLPLTDAWIHSNRLVAPFDVRARIPEAFYLVYRERDAARPELLAFRNWLLDQFTLVANISDESNSPETS